MLFLIFVLSFIASEMFMFAVTLLQSNGFGVIEALEGFEEAGRLEFAEVREDGEPSSSSLRTCPISLRNHFF